jgi:DnaJ-class molecular chaperone
MVKNHGMMNPDRHTQRGDLIVEFEVAFPPVGSISSEARRVRPRKREGVNNGTVERR